MYLAINTVLQTIILYILVIVPTEYLLTEHFLLYKQINNQTKTIVLLIIFFLVFIINYFYVKKFKYWLPIVIVFVLSLVGFYKYQQFYSALQQIPRIYSLSSDWSIQGKEIVIDGKNFGSVHPDSKVLGDGVEFQIRSWQSDEIVIIGPMTNDYGEHQLYIKLYNGRESEKIPFQFRDPGKLK